MSQNDYKIYSAPKENTLHIKNNKVQIFMIICAIILLLLIIAVGYVSAENINANLTSGWLSNETRDFKSGNNLTAIGTASLLTATTCGQFSTCKNLSVNDNDYYESLTFNKVVVGSAPRTMACWLKVTQAVGSSNQMAFGYGANLNVGNAVFQMGGSTPNIYAWYGGASDYQVNSQYIAGPMTLFFHIHNGTAQYIYRNYTLLNSTTMPETNALNTGNNTIRLGSSTWSATDDFVGLIGNCYLWNYALTVSDMQTIYYAEVNNTYAGISNWTNVTIPPMAPTNPKINNCNSTYMLNSTGGDNINITWNLSTDPNGDAIQYELELVGDDLINPCPLNDLRYCEFTADYATSYTNLFNITLLVLTYDGGLTNLSTDYNCKINICENTWVQSTQPCNDGLKFISYTDSAGCIRQYDLPLDNNTYLNCTTKTEDSLKSLNDNILTGNIYLIITAGLLTMIMILLYKSSRGN